MKRIFISHYKYTNYANWIVEGSNGKFKITDSIEDANLLLLTGGADISPSIYGEPNAHSWENEARDKVEIADIKFAIDNNIPIWGTCRGAQMLCAIAGGTVIQDVTGHAGSRHLMKTSSGVEFTINSLHHQMMNPFSLRESIDYEMLGWSAKSLSSHYLNGYDENVNMPKEPELCFFSSVKGSDKKMKALACQCHPEMMPFGDFQKYLLNLIETKLF